MNFPDVKSLMRPCWHASKIGLARAYRPLLGRTTFVGVTGSCGKTTTLELIATILARRGHVHKCSALTNPPHRVAGSILTTLPRDRFCVHELGGFEPGVLAGSVRLLRPHVGVVTTVGRDHYSAFRGLDATAKEKGTLVEALPETGVAVLNADDDRVLAMRERTTARVMTYGLSAEADVRGEDVVSAWPDRLSFGVHYRGERADIRSQLLGEHWVTAILAAVATGITLGVPLSDAAAAVERVPPVDGRMSPHSTADGITFIQDIWKAPLYSFPLVLSFLKTARAERKVLVVGSISDYSGRADRKFRDMARRAVELVDKAVFFGRWAHYALKARSHPEDDRILAFRNLHEANQFLREYVAPGDLVLLKGSNRNDHLERVMLDRTSGVDCWRVDCRMRMYCGDCRLRRSAFVPEG